MRAAFAELTAAVNEITARVRTRASLRVSVVPSFAARWLLPRIGSFLAAYPDVDLDVRSNMSNVDFQRDDADIAIRYGYGDWPDVAAEHLLDDWILPGLQPAHLRAAPPDSAPRIWRNSRCCARTDEPWKPWFEAAGLDWPEAIARTDLQRFGRTCCRQRPRGRGSRSPVTHCSWPTTCATAILLRALRHRGAGAEEVLARLPAAYRETLPSWRCFGGGCTTRSRPTGVPDAETTRHNDARLATRKAGTAPTGPPGVTAHTAR